MLASKPVLGLHFGLVVLLAPGLAGPARAADDLEELRRRVDEQERVISEQSEALADQQEQMDRQQQELDSLREELDELEAEPPAPADTASADPANEGEEEAGPPAAEEAVAGRSEERDEVGDLNRQAVSEGEFPGAILIPGPWKTSLRIGGFIKAVAIYDTKAEDQGALFIPAALGARREDDDGAFSIDATLTRLLLDARAPSSLGTVRGYVEWDLNDDNNGDVGFQIRHAFGTFETEWGTLLVGQTWSTFMDLKIIPEGLTEPSVSGVIFQRQPLIRWTQPLGAGFTLALAAEDPSSDDVFANDPDPNLFNTETPDGVMALAYDCPGVGSLRVGSIIRRIEVNIPGGGEKSEHGWGVSLTGSLHLFQDDVLRFSGIYGEGLGRYLLGIQPNAGGSIDAATNRFSLNQNWGAMLAYAHPWMDGLRSTAYAGYAEADRNDSDPPDSFESSMYAAANLMWSPLPFFTVGLEYAYSRRENRDDSDLDNHRIAFGFQIF